MVLLLHSRIFFSFPWKNRGYIIYYLRYLVLSMVDGYGETDWPSA